MNGSPRILSRGAKRRPLLIVGAGILFIVAALLGAVSYQRTPKELIAIADQLQPDASWQLVSERVEPERLLCIGDVACPSVDRVWKAESALSEDWFRSYVESSAIATPIQDDMCYVTAQNISCDISDSIDGYYLQVYFEADSDENSSKVSVFSRKDTDK